MIQKYAGFIFHALLVFALTACNGGRYDVDVSRVDLDLNINRFEDDLFTVSKENFREEVVELRDEHPRVYRMYIEHILQIGMYDRDDHLEKLKLFVFDKYWQEVYRDVQKKYPDLDEVEKELDDAFRHVKYHYPEDTVPDIYTIVKGIDLRYKVVTYENVMAIALDMYLGPKYKYYPSVYPEYLHKTFQREYIRPDVLMAHFAHKYPENAYAGTDLLGKMVYQGKVLYFLDVMAPEMADSLKIKYSSKQLEWAGYYEGNIWQALLEHEMLYETDHFMVDKYLAEGPFTNAPGIPHNSPPRIGEWLGWQIVRKFMEENPDIGFKEMFEMKDAQEILKMAGYKPEPM